MAVTHRMRSGMEFSTCGIRWVLRKFRILQSFGLQIFKLETEYSSSYKHTRPSKLEQRVTVCKNKELQQWWACFRITIVQGAWQWVAGQRHCDSKNTHCLDSSRRQRSGLGPRNLHVKSSSSDSDGQLRLETTDYTVFEITWWAFVFLNLPGSMTATAQACTHGTLPQQTSHSRVPCERDMFATASSCSARTRELLLNKAVQSGFLKARAVPTLPKTSKQANKGNTVLSYL